MGVVVESTAILGNILKGTATGMGKGRKDNLDLDGVVVMKRIPNVVQSEGDRDKVGWMRKHLRLWRM